MGRGEEPGSLAGRNCCLQKQLSGWVARQRGLQHRAIARRPALLISIGDGSGMRLCACKLSGRAYYARRCPRCGLANTRLRVIARRRPYRPRKESFSRDISVVEKIEAALRTCERIVPAVAPVEPARFRGMTEQQKSWSRDYRNWRYRAGAWSAAHDHDAEKLHRDCRQSIKDHLYQANRALRRAVGRVVRKSLPVLVTYGFSDWGNPWTDPVMSDCLLCRAGKVVEGGLCEDCQ